MRIEYGAVFNSVIVFLWLWLNFIFIFVQVVCMTVIADGVSSVLGHLFPFSDVCVGIS